VGLGVYGVSESQALTWALGYHALSFIPITLFGLFYLLRLGITLGDIRGAADRVERDVRDGARGVRRHPVTKDTAHERAPARGVRVQAPAKLNLVLRILAREASGYHGIESLFVKLALHDVVTVRTDVSDRSLTCAGPTVPTGGTLVHPTTISRGERRTRSPRRPAGPPASRSPSRSTSRWAADWAAAAPTRRPCCAGSTPSRRSPLPPPRCWRWPVRSAADVPFLTSDACWRGRGGAATGCSRCRRSPSARCTLATFPRA
jgi:hypothetical protein